MTLQKQKCPACLNYHFFTKEQWEMVKISMKCPGPILQRTHDGKPMKEKKG
jgi:hypothetical protein